MLLEIVVAKAVCKWLQDEMDVRFKDEGGIPEGMINAIRESLRVNKQSDQQTGREPDVK